MQTVAKMLERVDHEFNEFNEEMRMVQDKDIENDMQGVDEQWTELIDRGGLWGVTETTYQFFHVVALSM